MPSGSAASNPAAASSLLLSRVAGDVIALGYIYVGTPSQELVLDVRETESDPAPADPELA